jgi:hypothetical protein
MTKLDIKRIHVASIEVSKIACKLEERDWKIVKENGTMTKERLCDNCGEGQLCPD